MSYGDFLARKAQLDGDHGFEPLWTHDDTFDFQDQLIAWALRKGRAGIFADCGLGKTLMELDWADQVHAQTGKPVLLLTPLAVGYQTEAEAEKFGIEAAVSRDGSTPAKITITNYERLHYFNPEDFAGVVCDESSAIKAFKGKLRAAVTEFLRRLPYRLLCTATAAPNDYIELGTSSEALGYLGHTDMLSRFFVSDQNFVRRASWSGAKWRFKGHAEENFWRWVSSWARAVRRPSDLGFSDDGFELPALDYHQHVVGAEDLPEGRLFETEVIGFREEREELRRTLPERCEKAAELLADAESGVAWCQLNAEGDLLTELIDGAVQVSGSDSPDVKEEKLLAFGAGDVRVLVTKPSIGGWGLNWQHCHRMTYFPSHSYEQFYQAVRRCWRFGQESEVLVDIVTAEGGAKALNNLQRKADQADRMFDALIAHMNNAVAIERAETYNEEVLAPAWVS